MRFVETRVFTRLVCAVLSDESYRALQAGLVLRPEQGALVRGGGGLRKLRWPARGHGKRGGLRVLYYWDVRRDTIYMLYLYSKQEQEDLTPEQVRQLERVIREELK
jgi:hypothetical protein